MLEKLRRKRPKPEVLPQPSAHEDHAPMDIADLSRLLEEIDSRRVEDTGFHYFPITKAELAVLIKSCSTNYGDDETARQLNSRLQKIYTHCLVRSNGRISDCNGSRPA